MENAIYQQSHAKTDWDFSVTSLLEEYGWYLLIVAVFIFCIYRKAQPTIDHYLRDQAEKEYAAKYHKNPDLAVSRLAAQAVATQMRQEKYKEDAITYQQKMEEKESKKREEWLARHPSEGQKLGSATTSAKKDHSSLKPEYNPLMGHSSRSYQPQRKSACSGGGCGK